MRAFFGLALLPILVAPLFAQGTPDDIRKIRETRLLTSPRIQDLRVENANWFSSMVEIGAFIRYEKSGSKMIVGPAFVELEREERGRLVVAVHEKYIRTANKKMTTPLRIYREEEKKLIKLGEFKYTVKNGYALEMESD
jgi:hypothetical protein